VYRVDTNFWCMKIDAKEKEGEREKRKRV